MKANLLWRSKKGCTQFWGPRRDQFTSKQFLRILRKSTRTQFKSQREILNRSLRLITWWNRKWVKAKRAQSKDPLMNMNPRSRKERISSWTSTFELEKWPWSLQTSSQTKSTTELPKIPKSQTFLTASERLKNHPRLMKPMNLRSPRSSKQESRKSKRTRFKISSSSQSQPMKSPQNHDNRS